MSDNAEEYVQYATTSEMSMYVQRTSRFMLSMTVDREPPQSSPSWPMTSGPPESPLQVPQPLDAMAYHHRHSPPPPPQLMTNMVPSAPIPMMMAPYMPMAAYRNPPPDAYRMQLQPMSPAGPCVQPTESWEPTGPEPTGPEPQVQSPVPAERHSWLSLFRHRDGRTIGPAIGPASALECRQGELCIRFCSRCNALWPPTGTPHTHAMAGECVVTKFFPQNCVPMFKCYMCITEHRLEDIETHVATVHHDIAFGDGKEAYASYFCPKCCAVMYLPWTVFVHHRLKAHHGRFMHDRVTGAFNIRLPLVLTIMRRLIQNFLENGADDLLYACMVCKHVGTAACNQHVDCNACSERNNKFYCEHCRVVFSCVQFVYDIHRLTFEHFYLMHNRRVASDGFRPDHRDDGHDGDDGRYDNSGSEVVCDPGPSWSS